jgi:hypothetical protein
MGVVRFAMGFPHTFYVVAAPIPFRAMTAGIRMPAEIPHARDLTIKGVQFSKIFRYGENWTDVFHAGARCSRMGRDAHSRLRDACAGGNLPRHRRLHGKGNGRSYDRHRPDERLRPHCHRIRVRFRLVVTYDPLRSKQEMSHDCDEKRDRQPRRRRSAR